MEMQKLLVKRKEKIVKKEKLEMYLSYVYVNGEGKFKVKRYTTEEHEDALASPFVNRIMCIAASSHEAACKIAMERYVLK